MSYETTEDRPLSKRGGIDMMTTMPSKGSIETEVRDLYDNLTTAFGELDLLHEKIGPVLRPDDELRAESPKLGMDTQAGSAVSIRLQDANIRLKGLIADIGTLVGRVDL